MLTLRHLLHIVILDNYCLFSFLSMDRSCRAKLRLRPLCILIVFFIFLIYYLLIDPDCLKSYLPHHFTEFFLATIQWGGLIEWDCLHYCSLIIWVYSLSEIPEVPILLSLDFVEIVTEVHDLVLCCYAISFIFKLL